MSGIRNRGLTVLAGALLALPVLAVTAPAASADTNCGSFPGNSIANHDVISRTVTHGGRTVRVALVNQRLSDHSFAAVRSGYRSGDQTWVDRSSDGGANWTQCGPFNNIFSNDLLHKGYHMRACVRFNGASFCTGWKSDS
ncbi:hypothetical protein [Streptosporangium lutulentum]|uniref:ABC-type sugar transport system substrate-binding protein n=1 Tax=Streptosporangium lutulentum TaxID=1461250 RepID=A0ABT9QAI8_9ACTN|nr:hypothetical protein [Streptosporangium lutulentum]MDP9843380.1 ABC-type sugar transport system substrate-binding protein [Streptosporangium lutulentum]